MISYSFSLLEWFSGVILYPVTPDKTYRSVRILSTIISFGAGGSDWLIKVGALVTFYVLIYSLGDVFFQKLVTQIRTDLYVLSGVTGYNITPENHSNKEKEYEITCNITT